MPFCHSSQDWSQRPPGRDVYQSCTQTNKMCVTVQNSEMFIVVSLLMLNWWLLDCLMSALSVYVFVCAHVCIKDRLNRLVWSTREGEERQGEERRRRKETKEDWKGCKRCLNCYITSWLWLWSSVTLFFDLLEKTQTLYELTLSALIPLMCPSLKIIILCHDIRDMKELLGIKSDVRLICSVINFLIFHVETSRWETASNHSCNYKHVSWCCIQDALYALSGLWV